MNMLLFKVCYKMYNYYSKFYDVINCIYLDFRREVLFVLYFY